MAIVFENHSGEEDTRDGWKTYYLRVFDGYRCYYKFGLCTGAVRKRFARELSKLEIHVLRIWHHKSEYAAHRHEEKLFRSFPGDRPYIGRCGPFRYGGNTETYSHDVLGGAPPPESYVARIHFQDRCCLHATGYTDWDPRQDFSHLIGELRYMDWVLGPEPCEEGSYLQVPELSSRDTVVLATEGFLINYLDPRTPKYRPFSKMAAQEALDIGIVVELWSDHACMRFKGKPFKIDRWADWV